MLNDEDLPIKPSKIGDRRSPPLMQLSLCRETLGSSRGDGFLVGGIFMIFEWLFRLFFPATMWVSLDCNNFVTS
jgi:hypothetical protein